MNLSKLVTTSLSDTDIRHFLPGIKIVNYEQLSEYKTIEELLPKSRDAVVLFVELKTNTGHWECLARSGKNIYFFDSYSKRPDSCLNWIDKYQRKQFNENIPFVSYLLNGALEEGFNVSFNNICYQDKKNISVSTCGRWCVAFCKWVLYEPTNNNPKGFYKFIKHYSKDHQLTYDLSICQLVQ